MTLFCHLAHNLFQPYAPAPQALNPRRVQGMEFRAPEKYFRSFTPEPQTLNLEP